MNHLPLNIYTEIYLCTCVSKLYGNNRTMYICMYTTKHTVYMLKKIEYLLKT